MSDSERIEDQIDWRNISIREVFPDGSYGEVIIDNCFERSRAWGYADRSLRYNLRAVCVHCHKEQSKCKCVGRLQS